MLYIPSSLGQLYHLYIHGLMLMCELMQLKEIVCDKKVEVSHTCDRENLFSNV